MVLIEPSLIKFRPAAILVPHNRPRLAKRTTLGKIQELQMIERGMSLEKASKEETPQNLTPKFVEDMVVDVMEHNKSVEMFQAMAIVSMKMGNLGLEVQS